MGANCSIASNKVAHIPTKHYVRRLLLLKFKSVQLLKASDTITVIV